MTAHPRQGLMVIQKKAPQAHHARLWLIPSDGTSAASPASSAPSSKAVARLRLRLVPHGQGEVVAARRDPPDLLAAESADIGGLDVPVLVRVPLPGDLGMRRRKVVEARKDLAVVAVRATGVVPRVLGPVRYGNRPLVPKLALPPHALAGVGSPQWASACSCARGSTDLCQVRNARD